MYAVRAKIKNDRGATLLMALFLMLIVALLTAVILSASLTAAKRVSAEREQQQDYLTVSSAAQLMSEALCDASCEITVITRNGTKIVGEPDTDGQFAELISAAVYYIQRGVDYRKKITITAPDMPNVRADFHMDTNYNIKVVFGLDEEDSADSYRMTLNLSGTMAETLENGVAEDEIAYTVTTTQVTWGRPRILKGEPEE